MSKTHQPQSAPYRKWGEVGADFDQKSLDQLENACTLPVAVRAALMPDAHVGYGLPIGGVLATRDAVVPYAVGVDIACRVKLSVLDAPPEHLEQEHTRKRLTDAIERETKFGVGAGFREFNRRQHAVMDRDEWGACHTTRANKDKAWGQLGTSGSGNHFVEFGVLTVDASPSQGKGAEGRAGSADARLKSTSAARVLGGESSFDLEPGRYLALLSHSGSRGTGAAVCSHYSKLARELLPKLPKEQQHLAWLDLRSQAGQEYWVAMNLMGEYAHANHEVIHREIVKRLGARVIGGVENHHNFAWKETHEIDGEPLELIVHRKGATPAGEGVLGFIPGSMAAPGFVVEGLGQAESLNSAAHGAGRVMSRTAAKKQFVWGNVNRELREKGVTVLSAGIDEVPGVYKDIEQVMARQQDLVRPIARFDPKLVKMAPAGERPED